MITLASPFPIPEFQRKLQVEIYSFYDNNNYGASPLITGDEGLYDNFIVVDWLANDDIIYSLLRPTNGRIKTYVANLNNQTYYQPSLIEY